MRSRFLNVSLLLLLLTVVRLPARAADPASQPSSHGDTQIQNRQAPEPIDPEIQKRMEKARNEDRFKNLKRDSQKLLELATELKQYVDKADENVLSMEVIKKCDEIERLARSVRSKMKGN